MKGASKPAFATAALSAAAVLGYLTYRFSTDVDSAAEATAFAETLPDFTLENLDGRAVSIASLSDKPLLINFWATWCAPCLREIPLLKDFQATEPELGVVGIAVDRLDPVLSFASEMDFNYPVLVGQADAMEAAAAFGVKVFALPFTVFTSADGTILGIRTGEIHAEHLEDYAAVLDDLAAGKADVATARARIAGFM